MSFCGSAAGAGACACGHGLPGHSQMLMENEYHGVCRLWTRAWLVTK